MDADIKINLDLDVNVIYRAFPAIPGRRDGGVPIEPDEPETVEIQSVVASYQKEPEHGMKMVTCEVDITWLLTEADINRIEEQILEDL